MQGAHIWACSGQSVLTRCSRQGTEAPLRVGTKSLLFPCSFHRRVHLGFRDKLIHDTTVTLNVIHLLGSSLFQTLVPSRGFWTMISFPSLGTKLCVPGVFPGCLKPTILKCSPWAPGVPETLSGILGGHNYFQSNITSLWGDSLWVKLLGPYTNRGTGLNGARSPARAGKGEPSHSRASLTKP